MKEFKKQLKIIQKALLTGTSYMMPIVVAGGILFSLSLLGGDATDTGIVVTNPFMQNLKMIGSAGLFMMIPVLCAYVSYSIAGRPGLVPAFILGYLANTPINDAGVKTGFVGALILGLLAGYFVKWMKSWKVPNVIKSIMPILIIPLISTFVLGIFYFYCLATPVSWLVDVLMNFLSSLSGANIIVFAIIIGALCEIDMGGPITKAVSMFTLALISEGIMEPNAMFRVCCGVPPMAIAVSTILFKNKWTDADRDAGKSAGVMGIMGITEGAIPFVVSDLKHILPATITGCIVASVLAAVFNVQSPVPHGSFITLPMVTHKIGFCVAIIAGTLVGAVIMGLLRKPVEVKETRKKPVMKMQSMMKTVQAEAIEAAEEGLQAVSAAVNAPSSLASEKETVE